MKKWICLLLASLAGLAALAAGEMLPLDSRPLVEKKYDGWNGVLRIWAAEGWQSGSGSLTGWLNRCAAAFEKDFNGVYVQITPVEPEQLADLRASGLRPPDAILFAPGMLESADALTELPEDLPLRENLFPNLYAAPVALGGYAWAVQESEQPRTVLPFDDAFHSWSAAALSLSALPPQAEKEPEAPELPGIDLGLPTSASISAPIMERTETPYTDFINGEASRLAVSQREIARLKSLSDQGRGPEWTLDALSGAAFTDQLLLFAIPECDDEDAAARRELAQALLRRLLSDECQTALSDWGAFPATDAPSEYHATDPMCSIDLSLRTEGLITPPLFGKLWRADAAQALDQVLSGAQTADEAWHGLFGFSE